MNALGASILVFLLWVVSTRSRRWALLGMMAGVLYLTQGQNITVAGFNVFPTRFLEVAGIIRVIKRREFSLHKVNKFDKVLITLCLFTIIVYGLRTLDGFWYQFATGVDAILGFIVFRALIQDFDDFDWFLRGLAVMLVPYVAILWVERRTGRDLFDVMGGLTTGYYIRNGTVRCMGSFRHPSLMGSVGATFLPVYFSMCANKEMKNFAFLGIAMCLGMVVASNSGGPFNTAAVALVGWMVWGMRKKMRLFRWGLSSFFIFLAMIMKAPIYYLPAKVGAITGGGGYHRSYLIEAAIKDFRLWYVSGVDLLKTADWFPYQLEATGGADMTNYFLSYGVRAGIGSVILLVYLLVVAFSYIGRALREARDTLKDSYMEKMVWGLGVLLAAHISNWFSISYWDQFSVVFYLQLAAICSLSQYVLNKAAGLAETEPPAKVEVTQAMA